MKAYESGAAAYFATPPVNLIYAYHASLTSITKSFPSLPDRFKIHRQVSNQVKDAAAELGLKQVPLDPAYAANGMTAVRPYPHHTHDHTTTRFVTRLSPLFFDPFSLPSVLPHLRVPFPPVAIFVAARLASLPMFTMKIGG